jgi:uncharacterized Zn finger protein
MTPPKEAKVDKELVDARAACPKCGQRDQDMLVWQDDGKVKCGLCGTVYEPPVSA